MKIAIASVQVPFITGGAEILVNMLHDELKKRGHEVCLVTMPFKWYPEKSLIDCMLMGRMMDLTEVNGEKIDRVIAMKFPAFYVKHPHKCIWLMHQHRQAYDLWGTQYGDLDKMPNGENIRQMITINDTKYLMEAKNIYTIANNTTARLKKYNNLSSTPLYHPPLGYEKMHCENFGDYFFYPSRIDQLKRQRLMVEAARYVKTDVKFVISGGGSAAEVQHLKEQISKYNLENKVTLTGFISEEEKISYYANCLGVYFGAYDEDYGYITLEGFYSEKPVIVHTDSGGPLEFVEDGRNGRVIEPNAQKLAKCFDEFYNDRKLAESMGKAGRISLREKNMDWDYIIEKLLED